MNWDEAVQRALHGATAVLFVVSQASINSTNVLDELSLAIETKKWVIPLMIADVPMPMRAARLQRVNFLPNYGPALSHLVAYMRGGASPTTALEAIATAPAQPRRAGAPAYTPIPYDGGAQRQYSNSLEPVQRQVNATPPRSWIVPAVLGAGIATTVLIGGLLFLASQATSSASSGGDAGPPAVVPQAGNSASAVPSASGREVLEGSWLGPCVPEQNGRSHRLTITFTASTYSADDTHYATANCETPLLAISLTADIANVAPRGPGVYEMDYRLSNISLVPIASAEQLNLNGEFNFHQWRDGSRERSPPRLS